MKKLVKLKLYLALGVILFKVSIILLLLIAVKKIFGMMQYRVFAQTDETTIPLLANALRGSMNQSELETLPRLTKGQLFMNIAGQGNIVFNQQLLQPELERYGEIR